ncbi:MAG: tRNA pseudouridine(38-40) synthase TruA [Clostridia bacterium]|nr:tRNA pseudouridine(38-40) synthase TruA [Clostridia bacterium]
MTLRYEGTKYNGWQKQGNTANTIQGKLESILGKLDGAEVEVRGSGRTDAGVHAWGQVASFALEHGLPARTVMEYINQYLPQDIAVVELTEAEPHFHARLNAKGKHYRYRIHQSDVRDVFGRRWSWDCPEKLDIAAMEAAAAHMVGKLDFQSFCDLKNSKKSTVRRVDSIAITREGEDLVLDFRGEGFLYHMIRIMVGTLAEVGAGRMLPGQIPGILAACDRKQAGPLAPACGLMLMEVRY